MKFKFQNGVLNHVVESNLVFVTEGEITTESDLFIKISKLTIEFVLIYLGFDWIIHLFYWVAPLFGPIGGIQ